MTPDEMSVLSLLTRIHHSHNGIVPTNVSSKHKYLLERLDTNRDVGEVLLGIKGITEVSKSTFDTVSALLNWTKRNTRQV